MDLQGGRPRERLANMAATTTASHQSRFQRSSSQNGNGSFVLRGLLTRLNGACIAWGEGPRGAVPQWGVESRYLRVFASILRRFEGTVSVPSRCLRRKTLISHAFEGTKASYPFIYISNRRGTLFVRAYAREENGIYGNREEVPSCLRKRVKSRFFLRRHCEDGCLRTPECRSPHGEESERLRSICRPSSLCEELPPWP
jgi:hypothetical protein